MWIRKYIFSLIPSRSGSRYNPMERNYTNNTRMINPHTLWLNNFTSGNLFHSHTSICTMTYICFYSLRYYSKSWEYIKFILAGKLVKWSMVYSPNRISTVAKKNEVHHILIQKDLQSILSEKHDVEQCVAWRQLGKN